MTDFKDNVVLIVGAGQGLGAQLLHALGARGAIVAANDLTSINLDQAIEHINKQGGKAKAYTADFCKKLALQTALNEILDDHGRIDILINHASVQPRSLLLEMDEWDWRRTLDVNLTATFLACQSIGRVMRAQGGGKILNIGPVENDEGPIKRGAYLASKSGVPEFSRVAAAEFAEHNIRVNSMIPNKIKPEENLLLALRILAGDQSGECFRV